LIDLCKYLKGSSILINMP